MKRAGNDDNLGKVIISINNVRGKKLCMKRGKDAEAANYETTNGGDVWRNKRARGNALTQINRSGPWANNGN